MKNKTTYQETIKNISFLPQKVRLSKELNVFDLSLIVCALHDVDKETALKDIMAMREIILRGREVLN